MHEAWEEKKSGVYSTNPPVGFWHPADLATQITLHIEDVAATLTVLGKAGLISGRAGVDKGSEGA